MSISVQLTLASLSLPFSYFTKLFHSFAALGAANILSFSTQRTYNFLNTSSKPSSKMKCTAQIASLVLAATSALAAPSTAPTTTSHLEARSSSCASYYEWDDSPFTIYQNNWGASAATSGSQCTNVDSVSDSTAVWSTSWTWAGGSSSVKSYSNVGLMSVNKQLSAISSIPSTWQWRYVLI